MVLPVQQGLMEPTVRLVPLDQPVLTALRGRQGLMELPVQQELMEPTVQLVPLDQPVLAALRGRQGLMEAQGQPDPRDRREPQELTA